MLLAIDILKPSSYYRSGFRLNYTRAYILYLIYIRYLYKDLAKKIYVQIYKNEWTNV